MTEEENVKPSNAAIGEVPWHKPEERHNVARSMEALFHASNHIYRNHKSHEEVMSSLDAVANWAKRASDRWSENPSEFLDEVTLDSRRSTEGLTAEQARDAANHSTLCALRRNLTNACSGMARIKIETEGAVSRRGEAVLGQVLNVLEDVKGEVGRLGKIVDAHTDIMGDEKVAERVIGKRRELAPAAEEPKAKPFLVNEFIKAWRKDEDYKKVPKSLGQITYHLFVDADREVYVEPAANTGTKGPRKIVLYERMKDAGKRRKVAVCEYRDRVKLQQALSKIEGVVVSHKLRFALAEKLDNDINNYIRSTHKGDNK